MIHLRANVDPVKFERSSLTPAPPQLFAVCPP
jgi:hypothetical protein